MTRTNAREIALHLMFELAFSQRSATDLLEERLTKEHFAEMKEESYLYRQFPNKKQGDYIQNLVEGAFTHSPELDQYISDYAKGWSFSRIPRVAATMMRISMYEILYVPSIPNAAAINDALNIAKKYEDKDTVSFMNGILGSFVRHEFPDTPAAPSVQEEDFDTVEEVPEEEPIYLEETEEEAST